MMWMVTGTMLVTKLRGHALLKSAIFLPSMFDSPTLDECVTQPLPLYLEKQSVLPNGWSAFHIYLDYDFIYTLFRTPKLIFLLNPLFSLKPFHITVSGSELQLQRCLRGAQKRVEN